MTNSTKNIYPLFIDKIIKDFFKKVSMRLLIVKFIEFISGNHSENSKKELENQKRELKKNRFENGSRHPKNRQKN